MNNGAVAAQEFLSNNAKTREARPSRSAAGCAQRTALFLTHKLEQTMPAKRREKACLPSFDRSLPI